MLEIRHLDMLARTVPLQGKRVLDIGSGKGALVTGLAGAGAMAVGIEVQEPQVHAAQRRRPPSCPGFVVGGGESLPFADRSFDLALFFFSLHHVPQPDMLTALAEAGRVTGPGGHVYVAEPIAEGKYFELMRPVHDETLVRAQAIDALAQADRSGLKTLDCFTYLYPMSFDSADQFLDWLVGPDPSRAELVAILRPSLIENFHRSAERQGEAFMFRQPTRVNLLTVAAE